MKRQFTALLAALALLTVGAAARAQVPIPPGFQLSNGGTTTLSASTTSSRVAIANGPLALVQNQGNVPACVVAGNSQVVATWPCTASSVGYIGPGYYTIVPVQGAADLAGITGTGSTTLSIQVGYYQQNSSATPIIPVPTNGAPADDPSVNVPATATNLSFVATPTAYLSFCNEAAPGGGYIAINNNGAAVLNSAPSHTIWPGGCYTYESSYVPGGVTWSAIASIASTPLRVEYRSTSSPSAGPSFTDPSASIGNSPANLTFAHVPTVYLSFCNEAAAGGGYITLNNAGTASLNTQPSHTLWPGGCFLYENSFVPTGVTWSAVASVASTPLRVEYK